MEAAAHEETARTTAEKLMQEQLEHDTIATQFQVQEDHVHQEKEAEKV
jgi:hypothetical protein